MKKILLVLAIIFTVGTLSACTGMNRQTEGTIAGGVVGGVAGNVLTGGSAVGTGIGAVGGAVVGNQLSK